MKRLSRLPWLFIGVVAVLLILFYVVRNALLPFFVATGLAYLLAPLVSRLSRWMRRPWAVGIVLVGALGAVLFAIVLLLPRLWEQGMKLVHSIPTWRLLLQARLEPFLSRYPDLNTRLKEAMDGALQALRPEDVLASLKTAGAGILGVSLNVLALLLVPIILYYLLLEGATFLRGAEHLVPPRYRLRMRSYVADVHGRVGGYIRGQLAVASVMSCLHGILFFAMRVPNAWVLGLIAGFANFIPYSPYVLALLPALFVYAAGGAGWGKVLLLAGLFTAVQKAETVYFTPVWVGKATRLHPLEVLLALLGFGFLFGVLGLVFAVPLMIVVRVTFEHFLADYRVHAWYLGQESPTEE